MSKKYPAEAIKIGEVMKKMESDVTRDDLKQMDPDVIKKTIGGVKTEIDASKAILKQLEKDTKDFFDINQDAQFQQVMQKIDPLIVIYNQLCKKRYQLEIQNGALNMQIKSFKNKVSSESKKR